MLVRNCESNRPVVYKGEPFQCQYSTDWMNGYRFQVYNNWASASQAEHRSLVTTWMRDGRFIPIGTIAARSGLDPYISPDGYATFFALELRAAPPYTIYNVMWQEDQLAVRLERAVTRTARKAPAQRRRKR
ncbi:MAG: hypothetical protein ACKOPO_05190 [Novosphingobium sp.]